jgi:hypothetical protein
MIITDVTSSVMNSVNSSSATQFIEEISLTIAAQGLAPSMMSQDFLKFSGIIPQDWELAQQPILNPNYAQLNFTNGVGINAQPRTINLSESLNNKKVADITIDQVADKYLEKMPHAEYIGLSFNPKLLIPFPQTPFAVRQYITESLLGSGAWKHIGKAPIQASVNLLYQLDRCQLSINISEANLQRPQAAPITALLFAGTFGYSVRAEAEKSDDRKTQMISFLEQWQTDLEEFRAIVHQKFLDSTTADETQSIVGMSLFPGQML